MKKTLSSLLFSFFYTNEKYIKMFLLSLGIFWCLWVSAELDGFREIFDAGKYHNSSLGASDGSGIRNLLIDVFKDIAIVLFILAVILSFVATIRLLTSPNGEEDFSKWMTTLVWSIAGIFILSIAYTVIRQFETRVASTQSFSGQTMYELVINIVYPILNFLRYIAATCFFLMAVYAFYRIVTSMGDEEWAASGKKIFIGSVIGFIIMMIAEPIVKIAYGWGNCWWRSIFGVATDCTRRVFDTAGTLWIIARIIVFMNGFIALITVIMIMYAGFLILTGGGDEEKSDKAKRTISYAVIWIIILLFSYLIYRFMILQS